jgi:hypothetical protein
MMIESSFRGCSFSGKDAHTRCLPYLTLTDAGDMDAQADVVVHEILDTELLGEGVLPSMRDAYSRLLRPGAVSIPAAATLYAQVFDVPVAAVGIEVEAQPKFLSIPFPEQNVRDLGNFALSPRLGTHSTYCGHDNARLPKIRTPTSSDLKWLGGHPHDA